MLSHTDISEIFEPITEELQEVRELICSTVAQSSSQIESYMKHLNLSGGKMVRAGMVLLAGKVCGKIVDEHIRVAAIIEMVHNATLLHDDVIDEGRTRRGKLTANVMLGNEAAVLLGDWLFSRASSMCTELPISVSKAISSAAVCLCEGEIRQIMHKNDWQLTQDQYIDIIVGKSAKLFSTACRTAALLSHAGSKEVDLLEKFGRYTGIAFQITDDIMDIAGDESHTGKTLGNDIGNNELTLPVIHLLSNSREKSEVIDILQSAGSDMEFRNKIRRMCDLYGSIEYCRKTAHEFVRQACKAMEDFKESDAKNALVNTAEFMVNRIS